MEITLPTFNQFITEKVRDLKVKKPHRPKYDSKERGKHHQKISRGQNRKNLRYVPNIVKAASDMGSANKIVGIAKKAARGIWKVSRRQALDIAHKYKFYMPTANKPIKHLGTTGIQIWFRGPGVYYLIKPRE